MAEQRKGDRSRTNNRVVRVSDDLWDAAKAKAEQQGERISDVIRRALADYVGNPNATGVHGRGADAADAAPLKRRDQT
jgi:Mn-dependent DtxR family transcriptional regulator